MTKGWFCIPGVQEGDRTLDEQLKGLAPLLVEVKGKRVLDLGCAEGLIAQSVARAGAKRVLGVEVNIDFLKRARQLGLDASVVEFVEDDLNTPREQLLGATWDVVLALAIIHKMSQPAEALRRYAALATDLFVIRLPIGSTGRFSSKHWPDRFCDTRVEMPALGFVLERDETGPRGERVHYWRRKSVAAA